MPTSITQLDVKNLPPVLLLFGEEDFLIDEALEYLAKNIFPQISDPCDRDNLSPDNADLNKIVNISRSYPFLSEKRCVTVKNFDKYFPANSNSKNGEKTPFGRYLLSPQPSTFLVLSGEIPSIKGISKTNKISGKFPYNIIVGKYAWIEYKKLWESNFPTWIKTRLKQAGKTVSDEAVQLIIANCNPKLRDIKNEFDKLLIFVNGNDTVTADDVAKSIGISRQFNVFELQKAVEKLDISQSIYILQNILASSSAEMLILTILSRFFTSLWKLSSAGTITAQNKYQIAADIGVNPYFLNDYSAALRLWGIPRIDRAFPLLCEADRAIKTGQGDCKSIMESLIVKLLS